MPSPLLVLSNGHGEDLIALRLIEALRHQGERRPLAVLPLVGLGQAFSAGEAAGWLERIGPRRPLPSGGFSNQSLRGLLQDLAAGLPLLSWRQLQLVQRWSRQGQPILAVGDLLPLLLAWSGGGPFGFVGTPKSDATWASAAPPGWGASPLADRYHRCKGSEWDPWEWGLMRSSRCRLVAVRDPLTARGLRRHRVAALAPGNPMMDGFQSLPLPPALADQPRLLLLPGSRMPEALGNLERLLTALPAPGAPVTLLLCIGSQPPADALARLLQAQGFQQQSQASHRDLEADGHWQRPGYQLLVGRGRFEAWAGWATLGLATAGTATEQLVGLGIPALSLPGPGPQFKASFARRQSRLLGGAVQPCRDGATLRQRLTWLLAHPLERQRLGHIGQRRMGPAGGSDRLAQLIRERLLGS